MLKNFAFGKLPVRHRQDHHGISAGPLCVLRTPGRLRGRDIGNPDHDGYPAVDRRDRGVDDGIELRFVEVSQLAGAAQRRDCVHTGDYQPVDERTQLLGVDRGCRICGEWSHRVGNDAVDLRQRRFGHSKSFIRSERRGVGPAPAERSRRSWLGCGAGAMSSRGLHARAAPAAP